jgi:hypothetical protein
MPQTSLLTFEVWSDSFKEGEWFVESLLASFSPERSYRHNFQPVYKLRHSDTTRSISVEVYGDYGGWADVPAPVTDLLSIGKPDAILLDPVKNSIILAVEETAAVPTGNQALQRLERVWWAAKSRVPFAYLIPEYGLHLDLGLRRNSIWPSYLALKLSMQYQTPSVTLMYGDQQHPSAYEVGPGINLLASYVSLLLRLYIREAAQTEEAGHLKRIYLEMARFIRDHAEDITSYLPGREKLTDEATIDLIIRRVKGT